MTVHPAWRNGGNFYASRCRGMAFVYTLSIDGVAMRLCIHDPRGLHGELSDLMFYLCPCMYSHATCLGSAYESVAFDCWHSPVYDS